MMRWPLPIVIVRALNAAFWLATSTYCLIAYSPFAYQQFLKPDVLSWLPDFLAVHTALFWLFLLLTLLTLRLKPDLTPFPREGGGPLALWLARSYVAVNGLVGVALIVRPLLPSIGNTFRSLLIGLLSLVPMLWLAVYDHVEKESPAAIEPSDRARVLGTCVVTALILCAVYGVDASVRLQRVVGVSLSTASFVRALALSAVAHQFVFSGVFLGLAVIGGVVQMGRLSGRTEYWLLGIGWAVLLAFVTYGLAFTSIALVGRGPMAAAAAIGLTMTMVWSAVARRRIAARPVAVVTALELWLAPLTGSKACSDSTAGRAGAVAVLAVLPIVAYALVTATASLDWNFLIQKLGVLAVWLVAFAMVHVVIRPVNRGRSVSIALAIPPLVALGLFQAVRPFGTESSVVDRYAAIDMSFRLVRDLRVAHEGETAAFYAWLKANTFVAPVRITPPTVRFAPDSPQGVRPPHVFLFVIDSLRRDYVSAFNPAVTFTPSMASLASEGFAFERAWTRYAGTRLAAPAIWAGGMVVHEFDLTPFDSRNALLALLRSDRYRPIMALDNIMKELLPAEAAAVELDRYVPQMERELCHITRQLAAEIDKSSADGRPVFSYALPQNVHLGVVSTRRVASGRSYPGFYAPVADSVRALDACVGEFVDFLKRTGRYDDSILIVTSDHGDSLGEEGRWGHAYFMVPEVMRVPLIVHLPSRLRDRVRADLNRVAFTTDITPTLYALLGHEPVDLGPLFGGPLFVPRDRALADRHRESFLLGASYGAAYALLRHNGRTLYATDAVDGRDDAFDVSGGTGTRLTFSAEEVSLNRRIIVDHLARLAALNRFVPQP